MFVQFPQEETGRLRKLCRPWHGTYRIVSKSDQDETVTRVYLHGDPIQVHQLRITLRPPHLPAGLYWYGSKCRSPDRAPKWVEMLMSGGLRVSEQARHRVGREVLSYPSRWNCTLPTCRSTTRWPRYCRFLDSSSCCTSRTAKEGLQEV